MQSYNYNMIVSKNEAEALKEMIFNRVRQRAEAMTTDVQNSYTTSFKEEIMDIARNSFDTKRNPFVIQTSGQNNDSKAPDKQPEIGFKQKVSEDNIKEIIRLKNENTRQRIAQDEISGIMNKAGAEFEKSQKFTGALQFLNTQAGVNLANKNKASFEALA